MLRSGSMGTLSWSCNGETTGSIRYSMLTDKMVLNYRHRQHGDDWQNVTDEVYLDETPCNYGGSRKWFICPTCRKRVGILYGPGKFFRCRNCYCLSYSNQSESKLDRLYRKARKIRRKLDIGSEWWGPDNLSEPIFEKPKGMRWKTFERLSKAENQLQEDIDYGFLMRFGRWM